MIDRLGGVLLGDIGKVRINGSRRRAAVAKDALNMTET